MTMEERKARFEEAKKAREKKIKENAHGDFGSVEVPQFECAVLKPNKGMIVRLIGNSVEMAENDTDPIIVERSMIKGDDDKWFNLIWSSDSEHPMNKLKKTILGKYSWDKENKCRIYENANIPVFKRFMTNGIEGNPYNQGMNPQKFILFNCITRGDGDTWCKDNKHTKMLCWDASEKEVDGKMVTYPTYGVKPSFYKTIFEEKCTILSRHFEDTDFYVKRLDKSTKIGDSYLMILTPEEKSAIRNEGEKQNVDFLSYISDDYLSDEESKYEKFSLKNIPFVSAPTPISVILNKLKDFIREVDKTFNTNLYEEFVEWKAKELEELKKNTPTTSENKVEETKTTVVEETTVETVKEEVAEEDDLPTEVEPPKPTFKKIVKKSFDPMELADIIPYVGKLKESEKANIVGIDENIGELKIEGTDLCECPSCNQTIGDWNTCPFCGTEFDE